MAQRLQGGKIWLPSGVQYDDPRWLDSPGDRPPLVPHAIDDEFSDGSIDAKWAWRNQAACTIVEANGRQVLKFVKTDTVTQVRMREQNYPGADFTVSMKFAQNQYTEGATVAKAGICFVNTTSGKLITYAVAQVFGSNYTELSISRWTSVSAFSSTPIQVNTPIFGPSYLRVTQVSGVLTFYWSVDGYSWGRLNVTESLATWISSIDKVGFGGWNNSTNNDVEHGISWFRVTVP